MTTQTKLVWIGGVVMAAVVALYLGVSPGTLLIVGALLLCPAAMYFGMRGRGQQDQTQRGGTQEPSGGKESTKQTDEEKGRAASTE